MEMQQTLISMALALICGMLASRLANRVHLPAVTAYLITGLVLGPFGLGRIGLMGVGFNTMLAVENFKIVTQVALGFIAFTIGNEFRIHYLRSMGKQAITVGILQAVVTTILVDIALVTLHFLRPDIISLSGAITLGAIAAATAPAATLMVVRQYNADGPMTKLLLMVVAIDDAVGLVLFAVSYGVATALESGNISVLNVVVEPLVEIIGSLVVGSVAGWLLYVLEKYFHGGDSRVSAADAFVLLMVGTSLISFKVGPIHVHFSLLLVCMMLGTVFCNLTSNNDDLMGRVESWTVPVNILFFVLSGAELNLQILANPMVLLIGMVYIAFRSAGKISGAYLSCSMTHCSDKIRKHLGITLLPQAGVALGMAVTAANLSDGVVVRNVVLFSVLVYELVGPTLTKRSLIAAGEIKVTEEGRPMFSTPGKLTTHRPHMPHMHMPHMHMPEMFTHHPSTQPVPQHPQAGDHPKPHPMIMPEEPKGPPPDLHNK